jgi:hypothetical protein
MDPDPGFALHSIQGFPGKKPQFLDEDPPLFSGEDDLGQE